MFKQAVFKLTFWYLAIVMAISLFFSIAVYNVGTNEIASGIKLQTERIYSNFPVFDSNPILEPARDIRKEDHILFIRLVFFNLIVLLFAGIASFWLANRTLKPIEEAHEQQKRFTADVSHELRTPLTALRMESEVSLYNPKSSKEDLSNTLKSNLEEVGKLEALINNMLRLSKLEVDEIKQNFKEVNIHTIVNEAISKVKPIATQKSIAINLKSSKEILVQGDQESLVQLIIILLENGVKYSKENKEINIEIKLDNRHPQIIIEDQGIGISSDNLEHIFDRFYQVDISRNKGNAKEGFGLGLSIAKMIADIHNINIEIKSKIDQGTTVKLIFL